MSMTDAGSTNAGPAAQPSPTGLKSGLIAYFAGNRVAANLLMILLIVGGVLSGLQLIVQYYPDVEARRAAVSVLYPGASPQEVEEDINRRIEEAVVGLPGVERVVSTASQSIGKVMVEMATFADADAVFNDIQSAIDGIENFPPVRAEQPDVTLLKVSHEVMTLAVVSSSLSEDGLRLAAEGLRDRLLALPSVSQVSLKGTRDREITIELSEEELRRHSLSISEVSRKVRGASLNLTMGEIRTGTGSVILQTVAKRSAGQDFEDIPLITQLGGTIVTLGDVARIRDGFVDEDILTEVNGHPAVLVRIDATEEQSVVDMAEDIRNLLAVYEAPEGVGVSIWNDNASPIFDRLLEIVKNGAIGTILVFISLVLVFELRIALWMTVGIPLSFVGSLLFFDAADLTLNLGTIFGFFLLVGIVVDDSVVVGESIAAEREKGKNALDAAIFRRAGHGRAAHHRRHYDDSSIPAVPLHHIARVPDRERVPLRRDLRLARLPGCGVLHPTGSSLARKALEPLAVERRAEPGRRLAGRGARPGRGTCGLMGRAQRLAVDHRRTPRSRCRRPAPRLRYRSDRPLR